MLKDICLYLPEGDLELSVIDLDRNYKIAETDRILVAPTLIISSPPPARRVIAGLNDRGKIFSYLGITENNAE